jgi:2-amino-4-hydroxy-6-hydroxymethyldihydropteridine diphosphokinase
MARAYVGLGSNLGDRAGTLGRAVDLLGAEEGVTVVGVSRLHETEPVGVVDQPAFLNGAVAIDTELEPRALLARLLAIERVLGRNRASAERWGPRTVDLDLLLYGDDVIAAPGLAVPHPHLHERRFALEPLAELDPELVVPGRGPVSTLLAGLE